MKYFRRRSNTHTLRATAILCVALAGLLLPTTLGATHAAD